VWLRGLLNSLVSVSKNVWDMVKGFHHPMCVLAAEGRQSEASDHHPVLWSSSDTHHTRNGTRHLVQVTHHRVGLVRKLQCNSSNSLNSPGECHRPAWSRGGTIIAQGVLVAEGNGSSLGPDFMIPDGHHRSKKSCQENKMGNPLWMQLWHFLSSFSLPIPSTCSAAAGSCTSLRKNEGSTSPAASLAIRRPGERGPLSLALRPPVRPPMSRFLWGMAPTLAQTNPDPKPTLNNPDRPRCRELSASVLLLSRSKICLMDMAWMDAAARGEIPRKLIQVGRAMTSVYTLDRGPTRLPIASPQCFGFGSGFTLHWGCYTRGQKANNYHGGLTTQQARQRHTTTANGRGTVGGRRVPSRSCEGSRPVQASFSARRLRPAAEPDRSSETRECHHGLI